MSWLDRAHTERAEQELDAELRFDYDQRVAENIRKGMSEAEARRAARLEFGGIEQVKEECRDARGLQFLHSFLQDVRYALRGMRRSPAFTTVAVMTLAIGIGLNAAVFTISNAVLFKGFAKVVRNDRILYLTSRRYGRGVGTSWPEFEDWRAQARSFTGMAAVTGAITVFYEESSVSATYVAQPVSADAFHVLGVEPILGRDFSISDEAPGAPAVAILNYGLWDRQYGKDPSIIGQRVRMNGTPTTLIGVMPQGFSFSEKMDLWIPSGLPPGPTLDRRKRDDRGVGFVVGRMAEGVTERSARAEMETIGRRLASAYPLTDQDVVPTVENFTEAFIGPNAPLIYGSIWGAVGFVLLIACANLANLMLARGIGRSREISVRIAVGAGRWRITRQLLVESVMLSATGGAFGWWIARWGVRAWQLTEEQSCCKIRDYTMDYRVFAYFLAISIGTGILFGLAPALRPSKLDVNATLKDGGRGASGGGGGKHLSAILVMGEMALAIVLLAGAGVMIRSFLNLYTADLGVKTENILWAGLPLPAAKYTRTDQQISFYDRIKTRLEAIPGVESIAIASSVPMNGVLTRPYEFAGEQPVDAQRRPTLSALIIGPAYVRTVGATVLAGREFDDTDGASAVPAVIVNQRFANEYWPRQNPLGKRLRLFDGNTPEAWLTVVGVVSNIVQDYSSTRLEFDPLIYLPYRQNVAGNLCVIARTRVIPGSLVPAFRREIQAMDSDLPILGPFDLAERFKGSYRDSGSFAVLFLVFAATALMLASVGLYAVIAHSVTRRTQEIGIRMAIGAKALDVLRLVFNPGMVPVGIGLAIGLAASFAVNRLLKAELVHVSPTDPITLVVASATLILAAILGCWIPALRAMRVDPAVALRHD